MTWTAFLLSALVCGPPGPAPAEFGIAAIRATVAAVVRAELLPVSDPEVNPSESPAPKTAVPSSTTSSAPPLPATDPKVVLCSLNVVNEDPAKILQLLSTQTKTNLVLLAPSDKRLTLNLRAVPLTEMIRHVCALSGMQFLKVGETYVLAGADALKTAYPDEWEALHPTPKPIPEAPKPPIVVSSMMLSHISAARMATVLEKLFDKQVVAVSPGPVSESPQVTTQNTSQTTGAASSVLAPTAGIESGFGSKMLVIRGPAPLVRDVEEMARQLDVERAQVVIQVTIYDILDSALKELGTSWNFGSTTISENDVKNLNFGTFQRTGFSFTAAIKALEKKDAAKVLASPNIAVLDGERAFILIGDRINYPVLVGFSNANTPIFSKEEERVGIYLQVAASVSNDEQITLSLYPQVSSISGFLEVNGASYPQVSTREAQSTLRIKNGETLVMGGLLKTEEVRQLERVPVLSQIPFLGELFTRRKTTKSASQVLIVIRPTLLRHDEPR